MARWEDIAVKLIDRQERTEREEARRAHVDAFKAANPGVPYSEIWKNVEFTEGQKQFYPPGLMYEAHWYFDPADPEDAAKLPDLIEKAQRGDYMGHLSRHYYADWAAKRPPLIVICPDGREWCVDSKSCNGSGWTVTGNPLAGELITCSPSIWTKMSDPESYHGFLTNGVFRSC